ncbi:thiamine pyrophosphate-dependent acetolactate synthase large subunit-like protein [Microbacterium sp. AG157]|uniref:thiamine pyrophosphate-binding protein n=1 Tax=Microbacterium sp. AG157 TaxID=2183993 RepID=UPI000E22B15A|nr:thiamine pyrophosphate-binding protein [Microbacterium sp. AG157]REC99623.1 thiamine pyrophosphate-dependent acetolactate synthase large subunit-like protein [Microbacterium sp. AG157]
MPTVSAHVAHTLARHIDTVFGVMGNGNAYFLDALGRETPSGFVAVRHEAAGVVAADAHYRACGRLAAATATYGAGFTNTLTALAEAVQARTPLVLIVGDEPTSGPRPWGVDQIALAAAVGARTYTVGHRDAAATIVIAIEHALTYRLPVVLGIPYDVATREAGSIPPAEAPGAAPEVTPEHPPLGAFADKVIDQIVDALASAERPLLLGGRGAWLAGAGAALDDLAATAGALTTTSALGRGLFSDPARDLGVAGGFGAPGAMEIVREADVAVVFGASLNQFTMRFGELFSPGSRVFQVDLAPTATHAHIGGYVRGDAADVAIEITRRLRAQGATPSAWGQGLDLAAARRQPEGQGTGPDGRLDPRTAAARIAELLPQDRVIVSDGGHFLGWSNMYWPVASPDRMIMVGTAYQSIGLGFPSVPGAAVARPDSTIVLTTGDGGGLMALADLETAVRVAGGRGIAVVWNDAQYGAEVLNYGLKGLHPDPMLIPQVDFAAVARGFGAEGVVVESVDDLEALASWVTRPASERDFLLLDLRVSAAVVAPYWEEIAAR